MKNSIKAKKKINKNNKVAGKIPAPGADFIGTEARVSDKAKTTGADEANKGTEVPTPKEVNGEEAGELAKILPESEFTKLFNKTILEQDSAFDDDLGDFPEEDEGDDGEFGFDEDGEDEEEDPIVRLEDMAREFVEVVVGMGGFEEVDLGELGGNDEDGEDGEFGTDDFEEGGEDFGGDEGELAFGESIKQAPVKKVAKVKKPTKRKQKGVKETGKPTKLKSVTSVKQKVSGKLGKAKIDLFD